MFISVGISHIARILKKFTTLPRSLFIGPLLVQPLQFTTLSWPTISIVKSLVIKHNPAAAIHSHLLSQLTQTLTHPMMLLSTNKNSDADDTKLNVSYKHCIYICALCTRPLYYMPPFWPMIKDGLDQILLPRFGHATTLLGFSSLTQFC